MHIRSNLIALSPAENRMKNKRQFRLSLQPRRGGWFPIVAFNIVAALLIHLNVAVSRATSHSAEVRVQFDAANRLYEEEKYSEAASAYENLIRQGNRSASIHFNLGNACFKSGRPGLAIANYRLAACLAPRDSDIRQNLDFTRISLGKRSPASQSLWKQIPQILTLNELTMLAALSLWIWIGTRIIVFLRATRSKSIRFIRMSAGASAAVVGIWLSCGVLARITRPSAVAVAPEVVVRFGPLEESPGHYTVSEGTELFILERKRDWLQVRDNMRRTGWVQEDRLIIIPRI